MGINAALRRDRGQAGILYNYRPGIAWGNCSGSRTIAQAQCSFGGIAVYWNWKRLEKLQLASWLRISGLQFTSSIASLESPDSLININSIAIPERLMLLVLHRLICKFLITR
jgi:hypothetical protein